MAGYRYEYEPMAGVSLEEQPRYIGCFWVFGGMEAAVMSGRAGVTGISVPQVWGGALVAGTDLTSVLGMA